MTSFPDYMADLKAWLKSHPDLALLHGGRVFWRVPNKPSAAPFMRIYQAGGAPQPGETPLQDVRVSHEIWGMDNRDYAAVRALKTALLGAYFDVLTPTRLLASGDTMLLNAEVNSEIDMPDPDTGWPRYIVDAILTVRHI